VRNKLQLTVDEWRFMAPTTDRSLPRIVRPPRKGKHVPSTNRQDCVIQQRLATGFVSWLAIDPVGAEMSATSWPFGVVLHCSRHKAPPYVATCGTASAPAAPFTFSSEHLFRLPIRVYVTCSKLGECWSTRNCTYQTTFSIFCQDCGRSRAL
jgi:hypothetical protein